MNIQTIKTSILYLFIVAISGFVIASVINNEIVYAENFSSQCKVTTQGAVTVGDDLDAQILATSTNRAWAQISLNPREGNEVYIGFAGQAADATPGFSLASSTNIYTFAVGKGDQPPYTGALHALTGGSSTTIKVVECLY